jgi:hypothetical protein
MAVAEVEALSGFRFDEEELRRLTGIADLQRVELDKEDTKANIYFNPVSLPIIPFMNILSPIQLASLPHFLHSAWRCSRLFKPVQ